jgi:EF hand
VLNGRHGLNASDPSLQVKDIGMPAHTFANPDFMRSTTAFDWRHAVLVAALAMGAAAAVHAQSIAESSTGAPPHPARMAAPDTAPARQVTQVTQARRMDLDAAFARADLNRDGKLSRIEAEHFPAMAQRFDQIDSNRDNFISRDEFNEAATN